MQKTTIMVNMPQIKNKLLFSLFPLIIFAVMEILLIGFFEDVITEYLYYGLILLFTHLIFFIFILLFCNKFIYKLYFFYLWLVILWSLATMLPERDEFYYLAGLNSNYQNIAVNITSFTALYAFIIIVLIYSSCFRKN